MQEEAGAGWGPSGSPQHEGGEHTSRGPVPQDPVEESHTASPSHCHPPLRDPLVHLVRKEKGLVCRWGVVKVELSKTETIRYKIRLDRLEDARLVRKVYLWNMIEIK